MTKVYIGPRSINKFIYFYCESNCNLSFSSSFLLITLQCLRSPYHVNSWLTKLFFCLVKILTSLLNYRSWDLILPGVKNIQKVFFHDWKIVLQNLGIEYNNKSTKSIFQSNLNFFKLSTKFSGTNGHQNFDHKGFLFRCIRSLLFLLHYLIFYSKLSKNSFMFNF